MRELIYYTTKGFNLCSIKPIENSNIDRRFFILLVSKIYDVTSGLLHVEMSRPCYDIKIIINALSKISSIKNFVKSKSFFEFSFDYNETDDGVDIGELLYDIWFAFEHCMFCFFYKRSIENIQKNKAWNDITNEQKCYVIFKGIEEDVVWIGKSDDTSFADLMPPLPFEYRVV